MIKAIGIILIILSTSKIGFALAARLEKRRSTLISLKEALAVLEGEVSFSHISVTEAFSKLSRRGNAATDELFACIYHALTDEQMSLACAWDFAAKRLASRLCMTKEDMDIMRNFCAGFGKSDVENELKGIYNTAVRLNIQIGAAQNDCSVNRRIYRSGGVMCGILIAILLV